MPKIPSHRKSAEAKAPSITLSLSGDVVSNGSPNNLDIDGDGVDELTRIDKADSWLFPVDSGGSKLVLSGGGTDSTASVKEKHITALDPLRIPTNISNWTRTITVTDAELGDQWHVFKEATANYPNGRHWLSYHIPSGTPYLYLVEVTQDDRSDETVFTVSDAIDILPTYQAGADIVATNDHFMVDMANGVAVAVHGVDHGTVWYHVKNAIDVDTTAADYVEADYVKPPTQISGVVDPSLSHVSGGSAIRVSFAHPDWEDVREIHVFVPQTLDPSAASAILHLKTTNALDTAHTDLVSTISWTNAAGTEYNLAMPTVVVFENGWYVVTYRRIDRDKGRNQDYGEIVRDMYDAGGTWQSTEIVAAAVWGHGDASAPTVAWNRPHTTRFGDYLITCLSDSDEHAYLRVDDVKW